ncbi:MAG TPA: zinc-dependent metalloprotease [Usitatibacter sp.]|jgi:hypothetical protein|nr:zinc-dependent metalloprotease [Usitatibacter sp.]
MKRIASTFIRHAAVAAALAASLGATAASKGQTPPPADDGQPNQAAPLTPPPSATTPGAPASGPAKEQSNLRPFKEVVKEAKETQGFFNLFQKDDRAWLEIKPEQFEKPFYFAQTRTSGVGERMVIAGLMGASHVVYFKKVNGLVQLIAQNTRFQAREGTASERAVQSSFSDSLLSAAPIVSQPEGESKGVLVDVSALLMNDIPGASTLLEQAFHVPYALDGRNSSLVSADSSDHATGFNVSLHFSVPRLPAGGGMGEGPRVTPPVNTPDPRSLFLGYRYDFAQLPVPMTPRIADERVGYFMTSHVDFSDDLKPVPTVHYINRWRLEKKDPNAALSEPVKPIVYWLDKNIPEKYRRAVTDGILEWNKAFERIGFKDAIVVKQQPDDAKFDTADIGHASVRWYLSSDGGPAIGPSHVDPRTGEILDADILMTDVFTRGSRRFIVEDLPRSSSTGMQSQDVNGQSSKQLQLPRVFGPDDAAELCTFAQQSASEMDFALDVLEARGDLDPDSPEAEQFVYSYVKEVITHEVGHTLGLRHNFRASTAYTAEQLADPEFTKRNGVVASVMDYAPFNIPLKGQQKADYVNPGLGPYDYWAIEYGYKPLDGTHDREELAKIAARGSKEPWLAYATDEDSMIGGSPQGMDPTVNVWDLSNNPLAYYRKRLELSRELWDRLQSKQLNPGDTYDSLRRSFLAGFQQLSRGLTPATKYIGGVVQVRDRAGSGRLPFEPMPAKDQREALKILADGMLSVDSFKFKPQFLASLPYSRLDYFDQLSHGMAVPNQPMLNPQDMVLGMQRSVLDQVMNEATATRVLATQELVENPKDAFQLSELYDTLQASIWSELKAGQDISPMRRNLQREHLRRIVAILLRPTNGMPADARSLMRVDAQQLAVQIKAAQRHGNLSKETKAHLAESLGTLEDALKAPLIRMGA